MICNAAYACIEGDLHMCCIYVIKSLAYIYPTFEPAQIKKKLQIHFISTYIYTEYVCKKKVKKKNGIDKSEVCIYAREANSVIYVKCINLFSFAIYFMCLLYEKETYIYMACFRLCALLKK